jgi:hypothetical protein
MKSLLTFAFALVNCEDIIKPTIQKDGVKFFYSNFEIDEENRFHYIKMFTSNFYNPDD